MNNTCKNEPSLKENIKKLLTPIIYRLRHFLNRPSDETQKCLPNLMSSLVTILDHLSEESFEWFLLRIQDWFLVQFRLYYKKRVKIYEFGTKTKISQALMLISCTIYFIYWTLWYVPRMFFLHNGSNSRYRVFLT